MNTHKHFIEFTQQNYKSFVFATIFFSLLIVSAYNAGYSFELFAFPGKMIGEATLNAYDINKRIHLFYLSGILFFSGIVVLSFFAWRVYLFSEDIFKSYEFKIINFTSILGIVFLFFKLWGTSFELSIELTYSIQKMIVLSFIFRFVFIKNRDNATLFNYSFYSIVFILAFSLFFIFLEVFVLFANAPKPDFFITFGIIYFALCLLAFLYFKNKSYLNTQHLLDKYSYILAPITLLPLLSFLKDEIYLILNRHEVQFFKPSFVYVFLLFCLFTYVLIRAIKYKRLNIKTNIEQLLTHTYFVLFIISIAVFTFYQPFIESDNEMFEAGNRFLPIMEFQKFGVVPIFEKFNSHLLSELFFDSIYVLFNGLHGREMFLYHFIYQGLWVFVTYILFYKFTKNAYVAIFAIFFFPLIEHLVPDYLSIALLSIFIIEIIKRNTATVKNYLLLLFALAFLVLWKIDIGYPSIIATLALLIIYQLCEKEFKIDFKIATKSIIIFTTVIFTLLLTISWIRNINVFRKLCSGYNYLASAQSYGTTIMGNENQPAFKMHYFIFPLLILFIFIIMLVFLKKLNTSKEQKFAYLAILFLILFYFINFQRGLVRHSFAEGYDNSLSSFVFLILSGSAFLFWQNKSYLFRFILFIVTSTLLILNYKFPQPNTYSNICEKTLYKIQNYSPIPIKSSFVRCGTNNNFEEFKSFVSENLSPNQTFIDFSNTPMLYYITERISPSYFYQNPLTTHNTYLQDNFIAELKLYDAPFIVFRNFPENYWDNVDGVPNILRHYKMAEYFYKEFEPFVIINKLCIWKKKKCKIQNRTETIFKINTSKLDSLNVIDIKSAITLPKILLKIKYKQNKIIPLQVTENGKTIAPNYYDYVSRTDYYFSDMFRSEINLSINNLEKSIEKIEVISCQNIPDFYSDKCEHFDIKKLAYIWGMYDSEIKKLNTLNTFILNKFLLKSDVQYYDLPKNIDKSSGNIILLKTDSENEKDKTLVLFYGSKKDGYKGSFEFVLPKGKGEKSLAVRLSVQKNWQENSIDYIGISLKESESIYLNELKLLKGE